MRIRKLRLVRHIIRIVHCKNQDPLLAVVPFEERGTFFCHLKVEKRTTISLYSVSLAENNNQKNYVNYKVILLHEVHNSEPTSVLEYRNSNPLLLLFINYFVYFSLATMEISNNRYTLASLPLNNRLSEFNLRPKVKHRFYHFITSSIPPIC